MRHDRLLSALAAWDLPLEHAEPLHGGWNSITWLVSSRTGDRYVAKLADTDSAAAYLSGLRVAARAQSRGLTSGAPVPLVGGRLVAELEEGVLALLEYVPGRTPDTASPQDLRRMGALLARAHRVLGDDADDLGEQHRWPWPWVRACLRDLDMPEHLRRAVTEVMQEAREAAPLLRAGVVHGDPGPDSFRLSEHSPDLDGLIDWGAVLQAPLLYDLACAAVLTRDTPQALRHLLGGYRTVDPSIARDLEHLDLFVRVRWMANALYFTDRIARGVLRGSGGPAANEEGLAEAYAGMRALPAHIRVPPEYG
ncbi:phosphotransferase [Nonomuraea sp. NPDC052116]|uniref:phosphotransferase enzyme family protein n=1 Tax=Nonomuraea sp. NPDC052116 TaxID=3155665 RepID=UPI003427F7A9